MTSNYLKVGIILVALLVIGYVFFPRTGNKIPTTPDDVDNTQYQVYREFIVSGGVPKDGIPAIEKPRYVSIEEANSFLAEKDPVFILEDDDLVKIFPQQILVWHEIVNEEKDGEPISITYCPLTGSVIGYKGIVSSSETTFGTSGKLLNSNLVMYDRSTDSYWPQIFGQSVAGPLTGEKLIDFPILWTEWRHAKNVFPGAIVLSRSTGFIKPYGTDPYGSYTESNNYYDSGEPFFRVMNQDSRLESKTVVYGINLGDDQFAVLKSKAAEEMVINLERGDNHLVMFYDEALEIVRVYNRKVEDTIYSFEYDLLFKDEETGTSWTKFGKASSGQLTGVELERVTNFDCMWFAWVAFFPDTELIK